MSEVTGFACSKCAPLAARARVTRSMSRKRAPIPGRPNSTVNPDSPGWTRPVTSFVLTSSVPRPATPVDSWGTIGSENARRTLRGQDSSVSVNAPVGQTSGSGSKRNRKRRATPRMARTTAGFRLSRDIPR